MNKLGSMKWFMNKWHNLSNFGVKPDMTLSFQKKVVLLNQLSVIFFFILLLLHIFMIFFYIPLPVLSFLSIFIILTVPVLNKYGYHKLNAVLLSTLTPFFILLFSTLSKLDENNNVQIIAYIFPRLLLISTLTLPFIFIYKKHKWLIFATVLFILACIFLMDPFDKLIGVGLFQVNLDISIYYLINLFVVFPIAIILFGLIFLTNINTKYEDKIIGYVDELQTKNELLEEQKQKIKDTNEDLFQQKKEIQTQAKELEITNNKLKKLNATKDKFFSIIAHDLKSPFTALLGFSNLLMENHKEYDEEERERYIKFINDGSIKTYKLLENLLTWAHSQIGQIVFSPEKINIKTLIYEIILLFEETAGNKNIKLLDNTANNLFIYADKNMIDTVIRNLISNAIKFTPKGGEIIVNAHTITDKNNQKFTKISVKDSGVGISPEIQSNLFKITETISTKGTENEAGTGLGLILCKEFVEKHGGKIWVESEVDKGSKFIFIIPQTYKSKIDRML